MTHPDAASPVPTPADIIRDYRMEYLEGEGIWFHLIFRSDFGNAIYALITPEDFSALHVLNEDELWVHHDGAPVELMLLHPDGTWAHPTIGREPGMAHEVLVPAGTWQGAISRGPWSLVLCSLAPAFSGLRVASVDDDFTRWGVHPELLGRYRR